MIQAFIAEACQPGGGALALVSIRGRYMDEYLPHPHIEHEALWVGVLLALRVRANRISVPPEIHGLLNDSVPLTSPIQEVYYRAVQHKQDTPVEYIIYRDVSLGEKAARHLTRQLGEQADPIFQRLRKAMTPTESQELIIPRARGGKVTDFELYLLKAEANDPLRQVKPEEVEAMMTPEDRLAVRDVHGLKKDTRAEVYRWILRGLSAAQAIRKIQLKHNPRLNQRFREQLINSDL